MAAACLWLITVSAESASKIRLLHCIDDPGSATFMAAMSGRNCPPTSRPWSNPRPTCATNTQSAAVVLVRPLWEDKSCSISANTSTGSAGPGRLSHTTKALVLRCPPLVSSRAFVVFRFFLVYQHGGKWPQFLLRRITWPKHAARRGVVYGEMHLPS